MFIHETYLGRSSSFSVIMRLIGDIIFSLFISKRVHFSESLIFKAQLKKGMKYDDPALLQNIKCISTIHTLLWTLSVLATHEGKKNAPVQPQSRMWKTYTFVPIEQTVMSGIGS